MDLLEPTDHSTRCPFKGEARYWSVRAGGQVAENAAWGYPDPLEDAPPLAGLRRLLLEQAGRVARGGRARDRARARPLPPRRRPRHLAPRAAFRSTARWSPTPTRAKVIFETGLPPRWYFPAEDVRADALTESDTRTGCAYKGFASYRHVLAGGEHEEDLVWLYRGSAARGRADQGSPRVLQRACRHRGRRRAPGAAGHAVVAAPPTLAGHLS